MWTKLGDEFPDEARELSDAAFRTHVEALCWSNRRLLDLVIEKRDLKRFAETDNPDAAVDELVDIGWWQDAGGAWFIGTRFSEWQRDRSQVEHRREQQALAQKRRRRHLVGDHSLCLSCTQPVESTDDATDDSTVDSTVEQADDPGRDGTGRVSDLTTQGREQHTHARDEARDITGDVPRDQVEHAEPEPQQQQVEGERIACDHCLRIPTKRDNRDGSRLCRTCAPWLWEAA